MKFFSVGKLPSADSDISLSSFFLLFTKQSKFVRRVRLSNTQIYYTQGVLKTED